MAKFIVFHGSYTTVKEAKIRRGKNTKDFGVGFYCTEKALESLEFVSREVLK